jgi:hypothetical protein
VSGNNLYISPGSAALYADWMSTLTPTGPANVDEVLQVLRLLRNRIVGHDALKRYLVRETDIVGRLVQFINENVPSAIQREAINILGSIAYGGSLELSVLLQENVPKLLLNVLIVGGNDEKLGEAAIRALRTIYRHSTAPRELPFQTEYLDILTKLLEKGDGRVREYCAVMLANCCDQRDKQTALYGRGVAPIVVKMALASKGSPFSRLEASLDLIAALTRDNPEGARLVDAESGITAFLFNLLQRRSTFEIRIFASLCLANIFRGCFGRARASNGFPNDQIVKILMPSLVNLLSADSPVRSRAAQVLALLLSDSEHLQLAACEANVIAHLSSMLRNPQNERESEAALLALAALASFKEDCRKLVIEAKILPLILSAMESGEEGVRSAACQCTRSLSRSVKNLRTTLVDAGLATPLLRLLKDPSPVVQKTACAALCNLVLDFSPMKETVLKEGGVVRLVELIESSDADMRYNALWALKNLLYLADTHIKTQTMELVTYERLEIMTNDPSHQVQEQVLNLIRNLVCEKEQDIAEVLARFGEARLIRLIESKMASCQEEIVIHACYIVANACTAASVAPKEAVMNSRVILDKISALLQPGQPSAIQLAALWCVINLTWTDDTGSAERIGLLRRRGIEKQLQGLMKGPGLVADLRERVQTALDNFSALDPPRMSTRRSAASS